MLCHKQMIAHAQADCKAQTGQAAGSVRHAANSIHWQGMRTRIATRASTRTRRQRMMSMA